ncbi:MAG: hypothetical protein QCI38_03690, partial [Candidatus Thermoplasmatota archaeon]|nr:hypothetical protein [Candidatus Thermoplasmatota archaeon]
MRGKIAIMFGIMMVVSGFAFVANPGMGDVNRTDSQPTPVTWTALWNDANMWNNPPLSAEAEPIIINVPGAPNTGGAAFGGLFRLGDKDARFEFALELSENIVADVDFTINGAGPLTVNWIGVNAGPSAKTVTVANPTAGTHYVTGLVNISTQSAVETFYGMTMIITYNPGVQQTINMPLSLYVSSAGHPVATPDVKFRPQVVRDPGTDFRPYDDFQAANFALTNNAGYTLFWENTDTTNGIRVNVAMPAGGAITEAGNGYYMNPTDWNNLATRTLTYRISVAAQTAPGTYAGTFTWSYYRVRPVTGERVEVIESNIPYQIKVDFHVYLETSMPSIPTVTQRDTHLIEFNNLAFHQRGNVNLRDVQVTIDPNGDDDVLYYAWQYEQGAATGTDGGRKYPNQPLLLGDFATSDPAQVFNLEVELDWDTGYGPHYLPLVVEGWFFDTGVTGKATGWVHFRINWVAGVGNLIPGRDPFQTLRGNSAIVAPSAPWGSAGANYDFGSWTRFNVNLVGEWIASMESDVIVIPSPLEGGMVQTEDIIVEFNLECDESEEVWGLASTQFWIQGGPGTPFLAGPVNGGYVGDWKWLKPQEEVWKDGDDYDALFVVNIDIDVAYEDEWLIPYEVTSTNVQDGVVNTFRGWVLVDIQELRIPVTDVDGADLQIEQQSILIDRTYTFSNTLSGDLKDVYVHLQIGPGTPFLDAENHAATDIWTYVGAVSSGGDFEAAFDLDLNEAVGPGTWPVQLTVRGWMDDTNQYVEVADDSTLVIERLVPEPVDIFVSGMTYLDAASPGATFRIQFDITNLGGQRAHDVVVEWEPSANFDDWWILDEFLWIVHEYTDYVDTTNGEWGPTCQNAFDTADWSYVSNVSFNQMPGKWRLPLDESFDVLGIEDAADVYKLFDWTYKAFSSPVPQLYTWHIDTIMPGETVSIEMVFLADKEMIPGRVYSEEWNSYGPYIYVSWYDQEN